MVLALEVVVLVVVIVHTHGNCGSQDKCVAVADTRAPCPLAPTTNYF